MSDLFSPAATMKAVHATLDEAVAAIPPGKHNAVLIDGTYSDTDGATVRGLWVRRTDSGWITVLEGKVDRVHGLAGQVATAKSW
jgi:hypothetical protein